jgi:FtsP/CotA-like multicopper oxidase with cupredoxin domain
MLNEGSRGSLRAESGVEAGSRLDLLIDRRKFLGGSAGVLAALGLAACTGRAAPAAAQPIQPTDALVQSAEDRRTGAAAKVHTVALTARPATIDLGGPVVQTWAYGDSVPGSLIRLPAGDRLAATVTNALPNPTSVHWHGIALRNDMDGVPGLTQDAIPPGGSMTYEFTAAEPGTYMFHSHVGTQLDRGLYAPLIVDDPAEPLAYDAEHVVVLDDWLDGTGRTPDSVLQQLRSAGMDMSAGGGSPASQLLSGDAGDVQYPYFLINGRVSTAPNTVMFNPGARVRLRLLNLGADTAFRVALGGHRMSVVHTDGFPVRPVDTDAVLIGMGERIDVLVTLGDGVFPLVAMAEGKNASALEVIRTGSGSAPTAATRPSELGGRVTGALSLEAADSVFLPDKSPDRSHDVVLGGSMADYRWTINGRVYSDRKDLQVRPGEVVRLKMTNSTMMFHPMHLHGHTFQVRSASGRGPRKDTVLVMPGETVEADLVADNPGQWLLHCHNAYHAEAGMMTALSYVR